MKGFGLYIHIPFCPYKCNYCDFLTFAKADRGIDKYVEYLKKEINMYRWKGYSLDSIFIGGGTPSYIDSKYIVEIMDLVREVFQLQDDCEISIEMNPNTLTKEKIRDYLNCGINRFSLGVQTFDDEILKILGRSHTKDIIFKDVEMMRANGVKNLSVDMMLANPKQDMQVLERDLQCIAKLDIDHISYYTLILESKTMFDYWLKKGAIQLFDDDLEREMFNRVNDQLISLGFHRYEVSNFAKLGYESRHNKKYWQLKDYLAVGLGAASNIGNIRYKNQVTFKRYYEDIDNGEIPIMERELLSEEDREKEFIILNMRMTQGFDVNVINDRFQIDFTTKYKDVLEKHLAMNNIEIKNNIVRFTHMGMDLSNQFYIDII